MRILKITVIALAVLVALSSVWLHINARGKEDAPVIKCAEDDVIEATVSITDEELLKLVTATDKQDGDITSKIVVSRKNFFVSPKTTAVTYSVCDSDNNVTTLTRKLIFSDYHPPRIILTNDFIFPSGRVFNLGDYVVAEDVIDGNITSNIKLISSEYTSAQGEYIVNLKVSNSMADSTELNISAIVTNDDYSTLRIRLNEYIKYIAPNTEVDYRTFLSAIINKTSAKYDLDDVVVDSSEVDVSKPGVYNVYYRLFEGRGENATVVSMSRLVVVVEEA